MAFKLPNIGKMTKMKYNFNPILQNKLVLYLFLFMTLVQIVIYVNSSDITSIVFMCLLGFVTAFFSKNMIVILCVALVVTNILNTGLNRAGIEGMKEGADKATVKKTEPTEEAKAKADSIAKTEADSIAKTEADSIAKTEAEPAVAREPITNNEASETTNPEVKDMLTALKKEFPDLQKELMTGLENMDSIIGKTESFVHKYENYKQVKK